MAGQDGYDTVDSVILPDTVRVYQVGVGVGVSCMYCTSPYIHIHTLSRGTDLLLSKGIPLRLHYFVVAVLAWLARDDCTSVVAKE